MKRVLTIMCVAALMACMTGCGCGTMVDDGGTSMEGTTGTEEHTTTQDNYGGTSSEYDNHTGNDIYNNGTTEYYNDSIEDTDGVLNDIGEDIRDGVDDIVGTSEETTIDTRNR